MSLLEKLKQDLKEAMRAGDAKRLSTLRMLFTAIKNKEIEERKKDIGLGEEEVVAVLQKEAKKRKDAIEEYTKAGRPELAEGETEELRILEEYLPAELPDEAGNHRKNRAWNGKRAHPKIGRASCRERV